MPRVIIHREDGLRGIADSKGKDPHVRELDDNLDPNLRLRFRQRRLAPTRMDVSNCNKLFWCLWESPQDQLGDGDKNVL